MEIFPALLIGGPPHSGKSVLAYSLSQAFRQQGLQHYLLRACPDGEGDWANEVDQVLARTIRVKGEWTPNWVERICRDIAGRHLPLLVDVGGKPTTRQETIFSRCTHAVLLASSQNKLADWRTLAQRHGLTILAEIESSRVEPAEIRPGKPILNIRLNGLERGTSQTGAAFQALVNKLRPYFHYAPDEIRQLHLNSAPVETTIDLDRLARSLNVAVKGHQARWMPHHLPKALDYLPVRTSLGLYGRAPNWLYAAIALQTTPAPFFQFDVRLGWLTPPRLKLTESPTNDRLQCKLTNQTNAIRLNFSIPGTYLDYAQTETLTVPKLPMNKALIISGKLPLWLITALTLVYRNAPLLAVYQPKAGAVVVGSHIPNYAPGDHI